MGERPNRFPEGATDNREAVGGQLPAPAFPPSGKPTKRKPIPARVKVAVAVRQTQYGCLVCPLCGHFLYEFETRILEHMVPLALGGSNEADNLRFVHKTCADLKTNGRKATSHGSDKHAIAKAVRFDKINAGERSRTRKGPPLKTRPFQKVHRPFRRAP